MSEKFKDMMKGFSITRPPVPAAQIDSGTGSNITTANREISGTFTATTIDQKAMLDCDALFVDCEQFLTTAREVTQTSMNTNQNMREKLTNKFQKWRAKRKGNKLFAQYEGLVARLDGSENSIKTFTDRSLTDASSLMIQALHLKSRLSSCIDFNKKKLLQENPYLESAKEHLTKLYTEKATVNEMIVFYDEVMNCKLSQKEAYVPWAMRQAANANNLPPPKNPLLLMTVKRESLEKRIVQLQKAIEVFEKVITKYSPRVEQRKANLEQLVKSLHVLENLLLNLNSYRTFLRHTDEESFAKTTVRSDNFSSDDDHDQKSGQEKSRPESGVVVQTNPIMLSRENASTNAANNSTSSTVEKDEQSQGAPPSRDQADQRNSAEKEPQSDGSYTNSGYNSGDNSAGNEESLTVVENIVINNSGNVNIVNDGKTIATKNKKYLRRNSSLQALIQEVNQNTNAIDEKLFPEVYIEPYDHALCSDCSFVYSMANDCSMHLGTIQHLSQESTIRLQRLLELREKIKHRAEVLESIDWGDT